MELVGSTFSPGTSPRVWQVASLKTVWYVHNCRGLTVPAPAMVRTSARGSHAGARRCLKPARLLRRLTRSNCVHHVCVNFARRSWPRSVLTPRPTCCARCHAHVRCVCFPHHNIIEPAPHAATRWRHMVDLVGCTFREGPVPSLCKGASTNTLRFVC